MSPCYSPKRQKLVTKWFHEAVRIPFCHPHRACAGWGPTALSTPARGGPHLPGSSLLDLRCDFLALDPSSRSKVLVAAMERHIASVMGPNVDYSDPPFWKSHSTMPGIVSRLGRETLSLDRDLLFDLILYLGGAISHLRKPQLPRTAFELML